MSNQIRKTLMYAGLSLILSMIPVSIYAGYEPFRDYDDEGFDMEFFHNYARLRFSPLEIKLCFFGILILLVALFINERHERTKTILRIIGGILSYPIIFATISLLTTVVSDAVKLGFIVLGVFLLLGYGGKRKFRW